MRNLWLLMLLCGLIAGCKKDDPLSAQELTLALLTSAEAWQNPTVTIDDVDQSDLYVNFSITFGNKTYTSANGAPILKPVGKNNKAKAKKVGLDFAQKRSLTRAPANRLNQRLQLFCNVPVF